MGAERSHAPGDVFSLCLSAESPARPVPVWALYMAQALTRTKEEQWGARDCLYSISLAAGSEATHCLRWSQTFTGPGKFAPVRWTPAPRPRPTDCMFLACSTSLPLQPIISKPPPDRCDHLLYQNTPSSPIPVTPLLGLTTAGHQGTSQLGTGEKGLSLPAPTASRPPSLWERSSQHTHHGHLKGTVGVESLADGRELAARLSLI